MSSISPLLSGHNNNKLGGVKGGGGSPTQPERVPLAPPIGGTPTSTCCPVSPEVWLDLLSLFAGSKSDGQRSPNDTVFLRMDEIPYIHEDRPEIFGEEGERSAVLS